MSTSDSGSSVLGNHVSLGLPGHLAPRIVALGVARGSNAIAAVCLSASAVLLCVVASGASAAAAWASPIAVAAIGVLLWLLERRRTILVAVAYVMLGGGLLFAASAALQSVPGLMQSDFDAIRTSIVACHVALVMVGGVSSSLRVTAGLTTAGYVAGALGMSLAGMVTGTPMIRAYLPLVAFVLVLLVHAISTRADRIGRAAQPALHRAVRDVHLATARSELELSAVAFVHDTVLDDLDAIAVDDPGAPSGELLGRIQDDLRAIEGRNWASEHMHSTDMGSSRWRSTGLAAAVEHARTQGLDVVVTGAPEDADTLEPAEDTAVGLAVGQLLANVRRHAGVDSVEVIVGSTPDLFSVMVVDDGRGFDPAGVAADRLGLRHSVTSRIEALGGSVNLWSQPGKGTSVALHLPRRAQQSVAEQVAS